MSCAPSSFPPPPMNNPYGRPGRPGYTSLTYASVANNPVKSKPHAPHPPCNWAASSGSSYFNLDARMLNPIRTHAATKPHMIAAHGSTTEHPEVVRPAVHPAIVVVTAVLPIALHCP
ncbi:hypothetical protein QQP08_016286 [Theobroma cacao]|nr:hypothetical protein QQP08_016286 [Theobroma cacao]